MARFLPSGASLARQPARTLAAIAEQGPDVFYRGAIAEQIAASLRVRVAPLPAWILRRRNG